MRTIEGRRVAVAVGAIIVLAVLAYFLFIRDGDTEVQADGQPVAVSEGDLAALAEDIGHPIYWVGERPGTTLEATRLADDQVYIRYLTDDAEAGDPRPQFLTIGTYPVEDAYGTLEQFAERDDSTEEVLDDGGLAVRSDDAPSSVYVAYPDQDVQIEVYDPSPAQAFRIATSGEVRPVE